MIFDVCHNDISISIHIELLIDILLRTLLCVICTSIEFFFHTQGKFQEVYSACSNGSAVPFRGLEVGRKTLGKHLCGVVEVENDGPKTVLNIE